MLKLPIALFIIGLFSGLYGFTTLFGEDNLLAKIISITAFLLFIYTIMWRIKQK